MKEMGQTIIFLRFVASVSVALVQMNNTRTPGVSSVGCCKQCWGGRGVVGGRGGARTIPTPWKWFCYLDHLIHSRSLVGARSQDRVHQPQWCCWTETWNVSVSNLSPPAYQTCVPDRESKNCSHGNFVGFYTDLPDCRPAFHKFSGPWHWMQNCTEQSYGQIWRFYRWCLIIIIINTCRAPPLEMSPTGDSQWQLTDSRHWPLF